MTAPKRYNAQGYSADGTEILILNNADLVHIRNTAQTLKAEFVILFEVGEEPTARNIVGSMIRTPMGFLQRFAQNAPEARVLYNVARKLQVVR